MNDEYMGKYSAAVINLGCKVNKYEADSMKNRLAEAGVCIVETDDIADFYIVNTCSVTNMAERKSRQLLRRAKRRNPDAIVVAAGCYVNAAREALMNESFVDVVVGNNCKKDIVEILKPYMTDKDRTDGYKAEEFTHDSYVDIALSGEYEELGSLGKAYMDHQRAYIKIQDGCNQFCSYCIIPYTRGRVRSRKPERIIEEIRGLAASGVKEFVLTGIHISSYGIDFKQQNTSINDLGDIICAVADIAGVERIRLGSLEPRIITKEFLEKISGVLKLCPHFHLSLQSACNDTLKRMNRKYTIEEFEEKCELVRSYYDRPAITTDIIVGFPGETEKEFDTTLDNLRRLRLYEIHVFKYSVRSGTRAESMEEQVAEDIKNSRSDRVIQLTNIQRMEYVKELEGIEDEVLIEERIDKVTGDGVSGMSADDSQGLHTYTGYTKRYVKVEVESDHNIVNEIIHYIF